MNATSRFVLIASTEPQAAEIADEYREAEIRRHELGSAGPSAISSVVHTLKTAAKHFIVARPPFKTVIAGYHWLTSLRMAGYWNIHVQ